MSSSAGPYFVLREGATQEEQWTWGEIEQRCRTGEFGAETRIFMSDENAWVRAGDTDLFADLAAQLEAGEAGDAVDEVDESLRAEYNDALDRLSENADSLEALVEAGCLASDLGESDAAREHFQRALDVHPFNPRVAAEVKRRFGVSGSRSFRTLERPAAPWDNLMDVVEFALGAGWLYLAIPTVVFAAFMFLPGGGVVVAELAVLWCFVATAAAAAGRSAPPAWKQLRHDPLHRLVVPGGAMGAVSLQWLALFWCVARLGMLVERKGDIGVIEYIGSSPVLTVAITLCALCYLPAVMVTMGKTARAAVRVLNPWFVVRSIIRMEMEYATSVLLIFAIAVVVGVLGVVTGRIPVAGKFVWAAAVALAVPMCAFVLGRLRVRTAHKLSN